MIRDEFEFIDQIKPKKHYHSSIIKGIGDDSAVFRGSNTFDELICVDTMVEGIHFTRNTMTPYSIGYKALAANISDIAAMGGIPTYYLVSIAISSNWSDSDLFQIYKGMQELGNEFEMDLIGGDTVTSPNDLIISVTVCGKVEKGRSLLRNTAEKGDVVFVVGEIGGSAAGLQFLLKHGVHHHYVNSKKMLIQSHQLPKPQVEAGRILSKSGYRICLNDISDGLASELNEIAEASDVEIVIDFESLPIHRSLKNFSFDEKTRYSLFGGEDYMLVGTMGNTEYEKVNQTFNQKEVMITKIGEVIRKSNPKVFLNRNNTLEVLPKKGFNHFSKGE